MYDSIAIPRVEISTGFISAFQEFSTHLRRQGELVASTNEIKVSTPRLHRCRQNAHAIFLLPEKPCNKLKPTAQ